MTYPNALPTSSFALLMTCRICGVRMNALSVFVVSKTLWKIIGIGNYQSRICYLVLLLTTSRLFGQATCGDVQIQLIPDYSYAIGSSSAGTSYSFMLGSSTLTQGSMTQLDLFGAGVQAAVNSPFQRRITWKSRKHIFMQAIAC